MAVQEQRNVHIAAPGFRGLNTQDSPVGMDISFASIADHCVIDQFGRIASRKGFQLLTGNPEVLGNSWAQITYIFTSRAGVEYLFVCGNKKIFIQEQVAPFDLIELTLPVDYVITEDNWMIQTLADVVYFVQANHAPLKFTPTVSETALEEWTEQPAPGTPGNPNVSLTAWGHQFCAAFDGNKSLVTWSDFLIGDIYATGLSSGSIDLTEVWPTGWDEVVNMYAHNNFLVIFGHQSIVVFQMPDTGPIYMTLSDTVIGLGLVARDTVVGTGNDVFFLDATGVRSLGRTIQEKSVPIGDVSVNVRSDLQKAIKQSVPENIKATYHPDEAFYGVFFPDINTSFIFDTRQALENGALRPTRWPNLKIRNSTRSKDKTQYFCGRGGVYLYQNSDDISPDPTDNVTLITTPIPMRYYTNPQTFDMPSNLKFPKQLDITMIGSTELYLDVYWYFDYAIDANVNNYFRTGGVRAEYNISEYTVGEYSGAETLLSVETFNLWGNGRNVRFGFEATVTGTPLSIQELNIQTLVGRMV